jgi:hypothetical protein
MVPAVTHPAWTKLIKGEKQLRSSNVGINMLLFNSGIKYKKDPSPANLSSLARHVHEYFTKFEKGLQAEVNQLAS